eukprot:3566554-Pleurochrysis_carterae.AAC.2
MTAYEASDYRARVRALWIGHACATSTESLRVGVAEAIGNSACAVVRCARLGEGEAPRDRPAAVAHGAEYDALPRLHANETDARSNVLIVVA